VQLAQLYRKDKDDTAKCFAYAAAGIAQGPPRPDALFLNTNVSVDTVSASRFYLLELGKHSV
jgi:hypothetical protein